ncbi:hypothetical protein SUGI_0057400 [Cryptomeria japonica]|nr:hypothetical protein SUGI_0057400 [Cryptomeria japonica]
MLGWAQLAKHVGSSRDTIEPFPLVPSPIDLVDSSIEKWEAKARSDGVKGPRVEEGAAINTRSGLKGGKLECRGVLSPSAELETGEGSRGLSGRGATSGSLHCMGCGPHSGHNPL